MKKLLSLSIILQTVTALMAVALVMTFAISADRAVERLELAERVRATADSSRDMFMAMQTIRVERGTINTALESAQPADEEVRQDVAALRARSEKALSSALSKLRDAALAGTESSVAEIRAAHDAFNELRRQADAAVQKPKDQRPADLSKTWIAGGAKLVNAIDALSERLSNDIVRADPIIAEMMKIKQLGWIMRDAAGFDRLLVGAAIAKADGFPAELRQQTAVLTGRIEGAWKIIEDDTRPQATPAALKKAVANAKRLYFGEMRAKRTAIIDELSAGRPAPLTGNEWVKFSNPPLEAVIDVANVAFDLSETYAAEQAAAAKHNLYVALSLMLVFVGFGGFTMLFVVRRVAKPMAKITETMRCVAEGDLEREIPFEHRSDEVGDLGRALCVFRDNALAKQRMEGELIRKERLSALGQITATVAHELRNPLSAIHNSIYVIKQSAGSGSPLERPVARIERNIERCDRIIADLLSYTRVTELKWQSVAADSWLDTVLNDQTIPAGIALVRELAAPGHFVSLDVDRMRRVVINLIENAVQAFGEPANDAASQPETRRISVATRVAGTSLEIAIEDTGPGIPADVLPKVFEPLFSTKSFGTGLGLPTVKQIVEAHGGTIEIASELERGTRVVVKLELSDAVGIAA